jgi:hypothetical protein
MEAVAQTGPRTGVSISRGTTVVAPSTTAAFRGLAQVNDAKSAAFVPPLRSQRLSAYFCNGLHAREQPRRRRRRSVAMRELRHSSRRARLSRVPHGDSDGALASSHGDLARRGGRAYAAAWTIRRARIRHCGPHPARRTPASRRRQRRSWWSALSGRRSLLTRTLLRPMRSVRQSGRIERRPNRPSLRPPMTGSHTRRIGSRGHTHPPHARRST